MKIKISKEFWEAFTLGFFGVILSLLKWIIILFVLIWLLDYYLADNIIQVCIN